ncbi:MAG TPA: hypothetical protein DCZ95_11270 [Verrucomicrobia bacterium]|nr:MAG: hypothetical protein A2X46_05665 [Lentisphaerae bacterium GWF2_57_35]HBA84665.1 hypothetical protein [Verrucomicrobiota bacterium]
MQQHPTKSHSEDAGGSGQDFLEAIFRHKYLVAAFFLAVAGSTLYIVMSTPNTFTSSAKILVQRGRETISPAAMTGDMAPVSKDWENEINSEVEILNNHELVEQVVRAIGPERFLRPQSVPTVQPEKKKNPWLEKVKRHLKDNVKLLADRSPKPPVEAPNQDLADAIDAVRKNLFIESRKRSDVITIAFTATDPALAQETIATLLRLYEEKRLQLHSTQSARKFFLEQTASLLKELTDVESEIRRQLNELGVVSLDSGMSSLETRLSALQVQKLTVEAEWAAAQARIDSLTEMVMASQHSGNAPAKSGLVRGDYKDIQAALRLEETTRAAAAAEIQTLKLQIDETQKMLFRLNDREASLSDLGRRRELLTAKYRRYADSLEQTRIDQILEKEKFSNIKIVQAPTQPMQSNPSQKRLKLMLAGFMGLFGGMAMAMSLERISGKIRRLDEAEQRLQLVPLAAIPELHARKLFPLLTFRNNHHLLGQDSARRHQNGHSSHPNMHTVFSRLVRRIMTYRSLHTASPLILGVTSCHGGEGVTSIAAHLATSFTEFDGTNKVLYIDANRQAHSALHEEWLQGARGGMEVQLTPEGKVSFQPRQLDGAAGGDNAKSDVALERIGRDRITPILRRAAAQGFDVLVVDIPPLSAGSDAEHIAGLMSAVILVIEAERVRWQTVQWAKNLLTDTGTNLLGIVLNKQRTYIPSWLDRRG